MSSETETVGPRLKDFLVQLRTEFGILERLVYKHKNQHRRCTYFQYIMKVRRDLKLLHSAKMEEILESSFLVINGNRPKQKVQLLESLKRRRSNDDRYNFLERLLGVARLLSQMVEPVLKAATEISTLLAQSYFMRFSLTTLAVLARIRVLVQQMLLDAVFLYNTVSSLSQREQSIKLNQEGFEVFREYYPRKEEHNVKLDLIWQTDKYVLVETKDKNESKSARKDDEDALAKPSILYDNIEAFLGVDESEAIEDNHVPIDPNNINDDFTPESRKKVRVSSDNTEPSVSDVVYREEAANNTSGGIIPENCRKSSIEVGSGNARLSDNDSISLTGSRDHFLKPGRHNIKEKKKNVAFISVKPSAPSTTDQLSGKESMRDSKVDTFFQMLTGGNAGGNL